MRIIDAEQGTEEWLRARIGCPSGSGFSKLITSAGKPSTTRDTYVNQLIAEKVIGEIPETYSNEWMERGKILEPEARAFYEFEREVVVEEIGFIKHDTYEFGVSPDGLVGVDGGLEIKCPAPATHVKYIRSGKLPAEYKAQVMGCMLVTNRAWWDFLSYHPSLPPFLIRVERDEEFIEALESIVIDACNEIKTEAEKLEKLL